MKDSVLSLAELSERSGASASDLRAWAAVKLIKPVGFADEGTPLFAEADLARIDPIRKLRELGYGDEAIQRIVRKIGLPGRPGAGAPAGKEKFLTVGQLAERTGLSPRTIKHWEDVGILEPDMRSGGGFRLYAGIYVYLCQLIRDLQLFGYSLEEIKVIAGYFRDFLALKADPDAFPAAEASLKLEAMLAAIETLRGKMADLHEGIARWEDLSRKKRKEVVALRERQAKRLAGPGAKGK